MKINWRNPFFVKYLHRWSTTALTTDTSGPFSLPPWPLGPAIHQNRGLISSGFFWTPSKANHTRPNAGRRIVTPLCARAPIAPYFRAKSTKNRQPQRKKNNNRTYTHSYWHTGPSGTMAPIAVGVLQAAGNEGLSGAGWAEHTANEQVLKISPFRRRRLRSRWCQCSVKFPCQRLHLQYDN